MRRSLWIGSAALLVAVAAIAAWALWPRTIVIPADDTALAARGAPIYGQHCASCHGARLEGQPNWQARKPDGKLPAPPHDASGHTWHHPDRVLFDITKYGIARFAPPGYVSDMPAYEAILSDAEIVAVLAYIKSTWPPEIRGAQARLSRGGG